MTKRSGYTGDLTGTWWAADTGCFADPASYSNEVYLVYLRSKSRYASTCLFATAPDVPGDSQATLELSLPMLPRIREVGLPAAFIAQDGCESLPVPWNDFDCLFVAGSVKTKWKTSEAAYELVREAKQRGKWVHMGRCNSARRLIASHMAGYDSADGTFLAFGPEKNWPRVQSWLDELHRQPTFFRDAL